MKKLYHLEICQCLEIIRRLDKTALQGESLGGLPGKVEGLFVNDHEGTSEVDRDLGKAVHDLQTSEDLAGILRVVRVQFARGQGQFHPSHQNHRRDFCGHQFLFG